MKLLRGRRVWVLGAFLGYVLLALGFSAAYGASASRAPASVRNIGITAFSSATYSSPIAMSADNGRIWVVNPDDDSVSVIDPATDSVVNKFNVGDEPQSVALDAAGTAYVANAASNNVTVVSPTSGVIATLITGAEPWNIVSSPDGNRVFVANSAQDTITVIDTTTHAIIGSVDIANSACNDPDRSRHFQPRGMAVTANNSQLYVTRFLSFVKAGRVQATDTGKEGVVCRFTVNTAGPTAANVLTAPTAIALAAQVTGFKDAGGNDTSAYPNQLQSIVIRDNGGSPSAYLPNIAASTSGPLKFNVDTQAFVNRISGVGGVTQADAGALNMHLGARVPEPGKTRLFFANPWAIAFTNQSGSGNAYAVSAGSDLLVKLNVDGAGALSFTGGVSTTRHIDLNDTANPATSGLNAGKNPLGIVIRNIAPGNNKAYVMNYVSRNVSVVDLDTDSVVKAIALTALPTDGSQDEQLQVGKEIFFSSRGVFNGGKKDRLSSEGWQNCASCHFAGLTDGNVWSFNAGPRKSVPLNGTWNPHDPDDQRVLNYSAIFDEVQDFEANIRNVSGPGIGNGDPNHGLIISDTLNLDDPPLVVNAFAKPNAGRPQQTVTLPTHTTRWPALDAMNEWVRFAVRTPNRPLTTVELGAGNATGGLNPTTIAQGRALFFQAGCQTCHGGGKWTNSSRDFTPPPAGATIATETNPPPPAGVNPVGAQFLFGKLQDINSFGLGVAPSPFGGGIGGVEKANGGPQDALGKDHNGDGKGNGFNVPSLLGIWSLPPYYHNGACETLACVLSNQDHRTVRGTRADVLSSAADQARVVEFLKSIDADTKPGTNLYVNRHDIFLDPAAPIATDVFTPGVNLSIFGPNVTFTPAIKVKFTLFKYGSSTPIDSKEATLAGFTRDFGQERVISPQFTAPSQPGLYVMEVFADSDNTFQEDKENDNIGRRLFTIRPIPPDRTPPEISNVKINNDDAVTGSRDVTISFDASDPTSPAGQSTTGVQQFCIVRYYYDGRLRRWVEERCDFHSLPAGNNGNFSVNARLPNREGVGYAFVWVKDGAGNISTTPGFDFINFIPTGNELRLERNDIRVFRLRLNPGQSVSLTFTPTAGDVDATVFQGITDPVRCDVSAIKNGLTPETVSVPSASCTGTEFQIEVRGVVNSRYTISFIQSLNAAKPAQAPSGVVPSTIDPSDTTPTVAGPPALQAAIDGGSTIFLPLTVK